MSYLDTSINYRLNVKALCFHVQCDRIVCHHHNPLEAKLIDKDV